MDTLFLMTKGIENQATLIFPAAQRYGAGFLLIFMSPDAPIQRKNNRQSGLIIKQRMSVVHKPPMKNVCRLNKYLCRGRARGTTCSAQIGTGHGGQMGTARSAQ